MSAGSELLDMSMEIQLEGRDLPNMDFGSLSDPFAVIDVRTKGEWIEFGTLAVVILASRLASTFPSVR